MAAHRTTLALGVDDWARTRFVHSRLWETGQAVWTLTHSAGNCITGPGWTPSIRAAPPTDCRR